MVVTKMQDTWLAHLDIHPQLFYGNQPQGQCGQAVYDIHFTDTWFFAYTFLLDLSPCQEY